MKAIALERYGGPDVLRLRELPAPKVGPDVVLVRTRAAGVNPVDFKVRQGGLDAAFPTGFPLIPGWDVAGTVEATGPAVTSVEPGEPVFAYARKDHIQHGTYAELVAVPERAIARMPSSLGWTEAAAVPLAGLTAYQALRAVHVGAGDTVLVHAAAGGVGSFAVQIAVSFGARVIGTASAGNHDYLRGLGAEPVEYGDGLADRVREFAPFGVDAVLDLVGGTALVGSDKLVRDVTRLVSIVDAATVKEMGGRYVFVRPSAEQLTELGRLVDDEAVRVELGRVFPLAEAAAAQELLEGRHVRGKVVLEVAP